MKQTLTTSQAAHLLMQDENARWSRAGAYALIEHLEEYEEGCGMEIEFDAVAIRCDWHEYQSIFDAADDFGWEWEGDEDADEDEKERAALDWLMERTQVVEFDGGVIVQLC
jgi:hypothetical protein